MIDFTVVRLIQKTASSSVFLVQETVSQEFYVCKQLGKEYVIKNHQIAQVERELRLHSHLCAENILRMTAWFDDATSIYMVTESAELTVADLLKMPNRIDIALCKRLVKQLVNGLSYLHANHVLHRDLKPNNLFLFENASVLKIGDFGSSIHTLSPRKSFCGSVPYMSPEMISTDSYGFPHDVWSLGVCVYEMLTGRLPFDGDSPVEIFRRIVKSEPPISFVSEDQGLALLVRAALQKDPRLRPTASQLQLYFN